MDDAELSEPMSEEAAAAEATRRNLEAGARGEADYYWIEAQGLDGKLANVNVNVNCAG